MADLPNVNMFLDNNERARAIGLAPTAPRIENPFHEATQLDAKGQRKKAERIYLELLNADFDNPVILAALGMNFASQEMNGLAHLLLQRAYEGSGNIVEGFKRVGIIPKAEKPEDIDKFIDSKKAEILNALGTCWKHENKVDEARELFLKAQELIPLNADIQNNLGTLYINEGRPDEAAKYLELACTLQPGHPQASWNLSLAHLEMGDYERGWKNYDMGFPALVRGERNYAASTMPVWDGSPGKRVVVYGEQGIGDEIMFASCLNELIGMSDLVVFDCHKKLHKLFSNSFPGIDIYPTREDPSVQWPLNPDNSDKYGFTHRVAIGSLPKFFRPNLESFPGTPYIKPTVEKEAEWTARLAKMGDRPKVGISWEGGFKRTRMEVRSVTLDQLLPIFQAGKDKVDFISLQYTDCERSIRELKDKHSIDLHYFPEATHSPDYDDTASLVGNLDLVITVCTSVVHLAGSMGVPTWVLTPSRPAWRYRLDLDYMPWYGKTALLFRQAPGTVEWEPVIHEVTQALSTLLGE